MSGDSYSEEMPEEILENGLLGSVVGERNITSVAG